MCACLLRRFSQVWLFVTPWILDHQAPLSMGFSRQKYWSGLPCPPPECLPNPGIEPESPASPALQVNFFFFYCWAIQEASHLTMRVKVKVAQSCLTLCDPMDYTVHGILQAGTLEWVAFPFSRASSQPRSPALQADSLPAKPQRKSRNTGMGSLSLLQWIFLTQESNQGLVHCRWILYQLSYQASPY